MLVLSRRPGEGIVVGDGITITVVRVDDGKVRLGVEAPPGVSVTREEVYRLLKQEDDREAREADWPQ